MVVFRSEKRTVSKDLRKFPRTELRCNATIFGVDGILTITDISLGGMFIEAKLPNAIPAGETITINLKLPTEKNVRRIKARAVNQTNRGIGCQLIYRNELEKKAIFRCFDFVRETLPLE